MNRSARWHLAWIVAAALLGFGSAFLFADVLEMPRAWFLVPHALVVTGFVLAYARRSDTDLRGFWSRRLVAGLVAAALVSVVLIVNVLGQPPSVRPTGVALWLDLVWLGVVYGAIDALLLSVLPIVAAWRAGARLGWTARGPGKIAAAALGLAASAFVTAAYHLGYAEFRGPALAKAVAGNAMMSAAQLATASPVASTVSHVAMHIAAVLHGPETTVQRPPHRR